MPVANAPATTPEETTVSLGGSAGTARAFAHPAGSASVDVIVELDGPTISRMSAAGGSVPRARAPLERLRDDLESLAASMPTSKRDAPRLRHEYFRLVSGAAVTLDRSLIDRVRALPYVRRVVPDAEVRAFGVPAAPASASHGSVSPHSADGSGVSVAIVDSGIDYRHHALGGGFGPGFKVAGGWDFVNGDGDPLDDNGHGTHVAGIVAASSPELTGVAHAASLLAFKVLDAGGNGATSTILAALERCADPNGDGDLSDHVDVANLSLGGPGTADDLLATAVDAAVRAGVVVCVAAGNDGEWQSIGSPGSARLALTVGAVDSHGNVAPFSSRGPGSGNYGLKPEVVAPGVEIHSTLPGGAFGTMSGTSMSSPYVAGVAALLRSEHPDWSASEVRSRIIGSAAPVDAPPMTTGAGAVDAARASSTATFADPPSAGFGPVDLTLPTWNARRRIAIRNGGTASERYAVTATGTGAGLTIDLVPSSLEVPAGATAEFEAIVTVDNAALGFPGDGSSAFGGEITIEGAGERLRIPWTVVKGCRVSASWDDDAVVVAILLPTDAAPRFLQQTGPRSFEAMVIPGAYDVVLFAMSREGAPNALVAFEDRAVSADLALRAGLDDAPLAIAYTPHDEHGVPFPLSTADRTTCNWNRTVMLPGGSNSWISTLLGPSPDIRVSPLSPDYTIVGSEVCIDDPGSRLYSMEYEPARGVDASLERSAGGASLLRRVLDLRFSEAIAGTHELALGNTLHIDGRPFPWSAGRAFTLDASRWSGSLYLGESRDARMTYYARASASTFGTEEVAGVVGRYLHPTPSGTISHDSPEPPPTAYETPSGEPIAIGAGPALPFVTFVGGTSGIVVDVGYAGQLDDRVLPADSRVLLRDGAGATIGEGSSQVTIPSGAGRCRLDASASSHPVGGTLSRTTFTATLGSAENDPTPPVPTALLLLDEEGRRIVDRVAPGSVTRLRLSALDDRGAPAKVALRVRKGSGGAWVPLPLTLVGTDYESDAAHGRRGAIFEAEITAALSGDGHYDLELSLEDDAGNGSTTLVAPAWYSGPARSHPARR